MSKYVEASLLEALASRRSRLNALVDGGSHVVHVGDDAAREITASVNAIVALTNALPKPKRDLA